MRIPSYIYLSDIFEKKSNLSVLLAHSYNYVAAFQTTRRVVRFAAYQDICDIGSLELSLDYITTL